MYFKSTSSRPQISPFAFLTTISPCCLSFLLLFLFVYNEEYYFALWWNHCKLFDLFLNKQLCTCSKSLIRVVVLYRSVIILRIPPPLWRWRDMWMPPRLLICGIYLPTYLHASYWKWTSMPSILCNDITFKVCHLDTNHINQ